MTAWSCLLIKLRICKEILFASESRLAVSEVLYGGEMSSSRMFWPKLLEWLMVFIRIDCSTPITFKRSIVVWKVFIYLYVFLFLWGLTKDSTQDVKTWNFLKSFRLNLFIRNFLSQDLISNTAIHCNQNSEMKIWKH